MSKYLYLPVDCLDFHPNNIRRAYPPADVARMAESIRAHGGVAQALLVIPGDTALRYYVVDGNMRLAGARQLGTAAPRLKCEVLPDLSPVEQQLMMLTTSTFHFDKNAISEALAYQRIINDTGWSVRKLSTQTGISEAAIHNRLILLQLDEPIRQIVAGGKLSKDPRVARALLAITDSQQRIAFAKRAAANRSRIEVIVQSARRVAELAKPTAPPRQDQTNPAVKITPATVPSKPAQPSVQTPLGAAIYHLRANAGCFEAYADMLSATDPGAADDARGMARVNLAVVKELEVAACLPTRS